MLELKNISFSYKTIIPFKKNKVIDNLSLKFDKGLYSIIAQNGWEKTTLLKIIKGFLIPDCGEIIINGAKTKFKNYPSDYFSLFSNSFKNFYPQLTVIENIKLFLTLEDVKIDLKKINQFSKMLGIENYLNKKTQELSTGSIAKAILLKIFIEDKNFILLDEPFSNIDEKSLEIIKDYLTKISMKKTIIIATSKRNETKGFVNEKNIISY